MISVSNAESALKNIYLGVVSSHIISKNNPLLTISEKNTKTISGKDISFNIKHQNGNKVAVIDEAGQLPVNYDSVYTTVNTPIKNIYGSFSITDKAIKASQNNSKEFANLLNMSIENLVSSASYAVNKMLFSDGKDYIAKITATEITNAGLNRTIEPADVSLYPVGKVFSVFTGGKTFYANWQVTAVTEGVVSFKESNSESDFADFKEFYLYDENSRVAGRLNGIDSIFDRTTLYGATGNVHDIIGFNYNQTDAAKRAKLTEADFNLVYSKCKAGTGVDADLVLCDLKTRKQLYSSIKQHKTNFDTANVAGGFVTMSINGTPIYADANCLDNNIYFISTGTWSTYQLDSWNWLEGDGGSILIQQADKPVYNATLVKYCDFVCTKPYLNGKSFGYTY